MSTILMDIRQETPILLHFALGDCLKKFNSTTIISARRSGDEFLTLIFGRQREEEIFFVVERLWEEVQKAQILLPNGKAYKMRASCGMARYPQNTTDYRTLFQFADFAMYTAKHSHKGTIESFSPELYEKNRILLQGQEELNNLLEKRLVRYLLQPIISVRDARIYGYEMLMHPDTELFRSAIDILRVARDQCKLYDLEVMTWFEAMKTFARLNDCKIIPKDCKVYINSISNQMMHPDTIELFRKTFSRYLPQLVCEFTEEQ